MNQYFEGDACKVLDTLLSQGFTWDYCLTSPPYFGQIDYELEEQYGIEPTVEEYIAVQSEVFKRIYTGMSEGGVCWIIIGDTSNNYSPIRAKHQRKKPNQWRSRRKLQQGYREKELLKVPQRLGDRLRKDGWVWRQELIWDKGEGSQVHRGDSRPLTHEYILMMGKAAGRSRPYFKTNALGSSVLRHAPVSHPDHPCAFPQSLAEDLLFNCTQRDGIVIDPYVGTGTTLRAVSNFFMNGIGIDLKIDETARAS